MFELFSAWREVLHLSEWTGLGALVYFVPLARKLAIAGAVLVLVGWAGLVHGDAVGRADLQKQWDDSKAAAAVAQKARDADVARELEQKYQPQLEALQKQSAERKSRSDAYESKILALLAKSPGATSCQLGAAAVRVHGR
jgi:hypothetical protein